MRKVYYEYDPQRHVYKRIYPTLGQRLKSYANRILLMVIIGFAAFAVYYSLIPTTSVDRLRDDNSRLQSQYQVLSRKVDDALEVLRSIEQRDDNLYRVLLEAPPISDYVRNSGYNGIARYSDLMDISNSELVVNLSQRVDLLEKKLYVQSHSFDELVALYHDQEHRIDCIPAIQPINNKDLKRTASGYGYRIDPIYHVTKFHAGMDFTCDTGTPVHATGNGKVIYAKWMTGYGNCIDIDHGYGYVTRYAHLSKISVRVNQTVTRGETIGLAGSTGKSTAPHVHYEVHVGGVAVNPVNYYFLDLDPEGYEQMVEMSENQGRIYD